MLFRLKNALAMPYGCIEGCLILHLVDFWMGYPDDMLIASTNEKEHKDHIQKVQQHIQEFGLNCNNGKCQFGI
jgi:hypothetical protein